MKQRLATRKKTLSPQFKRFYKLAKAMLKIARNLNSKNASNKKRLEEMEKIIESESFFIERVNKVTAKFIQSQIKMQAKQSRGRRFSMEDKIFALTTVF